MNRFIMLIISLLFFTSCARSVNYKEAYVVKQQDQLFILLTGKRPLRSDNPQDWNKTYEDTVLIPIPTLKDGILKGEEIPVEKGHYKYKGQITIEGEQLKVNLFYDNYDDKTLDPVSWNGDYKLNK